MEYNTLFSPMNIGKVTIKNRIVMSPMFLGFGRFDGTPTETQLDYYEERAKGGTGLIITEITRVDDVNGASALAQLAMSHDYQVPGVRKLADRVHKHGAKLFVQLHHPGRQNLGLMVGTVPLSIAMDKITPLYAKAFYKAVPMGRKLLEKHLVPPVAAPSKVERSYHSDGVNRAMSNKEVKKLIASFVAAGARVKASGADGVELHAAHGYLIQQFLSPNTNKRTDEYGGSLENRMRFLLEIIAGIREKCGVDFPIVVRLTVDECYDRIGQPGKGYSLDEGVEMAKRLEQAGIDAIDVSSAAYDTFNYWLEPTSFECGWRAYMAKAVKEAVSIPVIAANLIRSPEQAEKQLNDGVQDFISLGRPHIADPHWAEKAQSGHEADIKRCICCLYCIESMEENNYKGTHACCSVNPFVGKEKKELEKNGDGKTVAVIGAGPAGLTAAELLGRRGFKVVLFEKAEKAGGQLILAAAPPHKGKLQWCIDDLVHACENNGVEFRLSTEATVEAVEALDPYAVVIATGGTAVKPRSIKGVNLPNVFTSTEILNGSVKADGKTVAVIGSGMTGLETAEMLTSQGCKVSIIEMADTVAPGTWMQHIDDALPRLREAGCKIYTSYRLAEISEGKIRVEPTVSGRSVFELNCDMVVLALGSKSENALYRPLKAKRDNVFLIGDAERGGRIADATAAAYNAVCSIK